MVLLALLGCAGERGPQGTTGTPGATGPQGPPGMVVITPLGDGGFRLEGDAGLQVVQGPPGPEGPRGQQGPPGPQGPAGQGVGASLVDSNGKVVGPVFSPRTTYGTFGYVDASGYLWLIDPETGELSSTQGLGNTWTLYVQSNCAGTAYLQLGANGSSQRIAMINAVVDRDTQLLVRRGPLVWNLGTVLSYRTITGTCTNTNSTPFDAAYGPYILATDMVPVTKPTITWVAPLHIRL